MKTRTWLWIPFLLLAGCRPTAARSNIYAAAGQPVPGTARAPDGVPIAYDVRGRGDVALVFVHCWACDRTFWREQLDVFAADYRVVSLDLAGHGFSGADRRSWSIAGLADDVKAVADALGLQRMVLVGHSMGGPVSLLAAARLRGRVAGVVCVDTVHNAEQRLPKEAFAKITAQLEGDFDKSMAGFIRAFFPPGAPKSTVDFVLEKGRGANRPAVMAIFRDFPNLDFKAVLGGAGVPVRGINAAPRPPMIPPTAVATNRKYADYDAVIIQGAGHYLMLEKPAEFNARLRDVVRELASRK